jgi:site-specific DNA recombinase
MQHLAVHASIYVRISSDREGAGLGVGAQQADCRQLAAELGAVVVEPVLVDNDVSAYSGKPRPQYRELLRRIAAGETDVVLVWHTDRLHRSPAELEEYISLCETLGVRTVTVKAGDLDLASPSGLVMARTLGAFARYEVDHARERMKRAKLRSAEAGTWKGGRRPFGYEADGITVNQTEAAALRDAADRVLAGEPIRAIARAWNDAGVLTTTGGRWTLHGPRRVLLRPRNAGLMEHRGEIVGEAAWPAIIEPEKWRAVVRLLEDPSRRTNHTNSAVRHLGSHLFRCSVCGSHVRADKIRGEIPAYRCAASACVVRVQQPVDAFVRDLVVERLRRPDLADLLVENEAGVDVRALELRAVELTERKNQLAAVFAEGAIDAQQLAAGSRRLQHELDDVRNQVAAAYSGSALDGVGSAPDPGAAFLEASLDRQRLVVDALMTVTLLPSGRGRPAGWKPGQSYFRRETVQIDWRSSDA